jgi:membrane dipeptidase
MIPIFDGHNDTLLTLFSLDNKKKRSILKKSETGHIDLPRAREGGLFGGIFAINVPTPNYNAKNVLLLTKHGYKVEMSPKINHTYAKNFTDYILGHLFNLEEESEEKIKIIKSFNDLGVCFTKKQLGIVIEFEGAEVLRKDLKNLKIYYEQGLRSIGIVWSRPNDFGYGVPFQFPHSPDIGPGLTEYGKKLVKRCNTLGILIDLAHLNEKGFWDVVELSTDPLLVSHSGVYSLCNSTRNLTDEQIDAIGDSNGIIGIYFDSTNLLQDGMPNNHIDLSVIVDHIDYIAQEIGVDHVGFGSDFDGAEMPANLKDVAYLPKLIDALKQRGYQKEEIKKIAYKNWCRVCKTTWSK